jgi:hypothetical protein
MSLLFWEIDDADDGRTLMAISLAHPKHGVSRLQFSNSVAQAMIYNTAIQPIKLAPPIIKWQNRKFI